MRSIKQMFRFEAGVVQLKTGTFFEPLREAMNRWVIQEACAYRAAGTNFRVLYELKTGGFAYVEYLARHVEVAQRPSQPLQIWVGELTGDAQIVSDAEALRFIQEVQCPVPKCLKYLLKREPNEIAEAVETEEPIRPLNHWAALGSLGSRRKASKTEPLKVARQVHYFAVRTTQLLAAWESGGVPSDNGGTLDFLGSLLFSKYETAPRDWYAKPDQPIEPGLLDLPWPPACEAVRSALRDLQNLLEDPLSAWQVRRKLSLSDPNYPSAGEQQAAAEALIATLPELERLTARLRLALSEVDGDSELDGSDLADIDAQEVETLKNEQRATSPIDEGSEPPIGVDPLSERAQDVLVAMLELGAIDSDARRKTPEIAVKALGDGTDPNSLKVVMSELRTRELVSSKTGRGGGCWLTDTGRSRADKLRNQ